jgi:hypothetical protein
LRASDPGQQRTVHVYRSGEAMTTEGAGLTARSASRDDGYDRQHSISGWLDDASSDGASTAEVPLADDHVDTTLRVRPYARTGGRTRSSIDLAIETMVTSSQSSSAQIVRPEHRAIIRLCRRPHSVAEVAAKMQLPLGVVRVLLSDMSGLSLIEIHHNAEAVGGHPSMALMERVLAGLRRI